MAAEILYEDRVLSDPEMAMRWGCSQHNVDPG